MRKSQLICSLLALALCLLPAGCRSREAEEPVEPENVTLNVKPVPAWAKPVAKEKYILTPPAPERPVINNPLVYGARPGDVYKRQRLL